MGGKDIDGLELEGLFAFKLGGVPLVVNSKFVFALFEGAVDSTPNFAEGIFGFHEVPDLEVFVG